MGRDMAEGKAPSEGESVKSASRYLRGGLAGPVDDITADFSDDDRDLLRFHGVHPERTGLTMVRVRIPAGRLTPGQYLALDDLAGRYGNGSLRLTSRQAIQFHGVRKADLKALVSEVHHSLLTTMGAGGDVVRNIMANPVPFKDAVHARLLEDARRLAKLLRPRTRAYREVWLDGATLPEPPGLPVGEVEPVYGATYLPHKFKIALATPDDNSVDVFAQDLGIIALFEGDLLTGYNFLLGGGLGHRHGDPADRTRLAEPVCFIEPDDLVPAVEAVVALHRDHGDRCDRRRGRLKALIGERGAAWAKARLEEHLGHPLAPPQPMPPMQVPELIGWYDQGDGKWFLGLPIAAGRIIDTETHRLRTGLRVVIEKYWPTVVLTPGQDILLADLPPSKRPAIEADLRRFGVRLADDVIPLERWMLACPSLPTCSLALAEAEGVASRLIDAIAEVMAEHGLGRERLSLRLAGCGCGCSRPLLGDIGVVGCEPGRYRLFVGGNLQGTRLGRPLCDGLTEAGIAAALAPLFALFAAERRPGESFGDFCHRAGLERLTRQGQP